MSTADLTKATRELFVRTRDNQVYYRTPLVEELRRRNQITYKGGKYIEKLADTATTEDHWQEYSANDPLTDQKTSVLEKPRFLWKLGQYPLRYDVDEELQNVHAGHEEQLLDLAQFLSEKAQKDQRLWLCAKIFNSGSTTPVADGGKVFQSLISAFDHDNTYGTITRSLSGGTNDWWQSAESTDLTTNVTSSTQDTAYNLTKANLRKWINETDVSHYMDGADDLQILMCPTLWNKLAAELESHTEYKGGLKQSQGIRSMVFDGHEIVSVPYLQRSSTMKTWLFICNMRYLELRIHANRNFVMKDFKWQGENANGYDYWLARILVSGNLVCWKPNSSLWLSNVS